MTIAEVKEIIARADAARDAKRVTSSAAGVGTLRGAMSGACYPDGKTIAAKCPRLDQARFQGVEAGTDSASRVVFAAGFGHENYLAEAFGAGGHLIINGSAESIDWETFKARNLPRCAVKEQPLRALVRGREWRGTPDFILVGDGKMTGVEAKCQLSAFGAVKSIKAGWPQRKHVLQACNYMASLDAKEWVIAVGHYFYAAVDGQKYPPMVRWFRITLVTVDGAERYGMENEEGKTVTLDFGPKAVLDYQELIHKHATSRTLAPRPKWVELGPGLSSYDECNYCGADMLNECNRYDVGRLDYQGWLDRLAGKKK